MKENAEAASAGSGGALIVAQQIAALVEANPGVEVHLVGHSAGAILLARFLQVLKVKVKTCTLWAPACTVDLFNATYARRAMAVCSQIANLADPVAAVMRWRYHK